jgi:homogentisate 1,2-dioxygenase
MTFEKELEAPSEDEGFARVDALPFTPRFAGEEDRRRFLWRL